MWTKLGLMYLCFRYKDKCVKMIKVKVYISGGFHFPFQILFSKTTNLELIPDF